MGLLLWKRFVIKILSTVSDLMSIGLLKEYHPVAYNLLSQVLSFIFIDNAKP